MFLRFSYVCGGRKEGRLTFFSLALSVKYSNSSKSHPLKPRKITA